MTRSRLLGAAVGLVVATLIASSAVAANPTPSFIPQTADWLTTVNYYRAMAGLSPVVENPTMSAGAAAHSCYMLQNGIAHDELPGLPGYTTEGDAAGNASNVAVSSVINTSARSHVELWMSGPFHAIGVLRPNLQSTGFGKCDRGDTPVWHSGATLDVIRGLGPKAPRADPILFPGNGTTTNLDRFVVETPEPPGLLPRMVGPSRPTDHRLDARDRNQPQRVGDRTERADRCLRAIGGQHHRGRPADTGR